MQTLRPYQSDTVHKVFDAWRSGKRAPLIVLPTGAGKTTVCAHVIRRARAAAPGLRVLMLCPLQQLVWQATERFRQHNINAGILMGPRKPKPGETCHVASVQTAIRRDLGDYGLVIYDEAHRAAGVESAKLLRRYKNSFGLGMTATPRRLDGRSLQPLFDHLIEPVSVQQLMDAGFLVPIKAYARDELDLSKVKWDRRKNDYSSRSLSSAMNQPKLVGDVVDHWGRLCRGRRTIVFACSIPHAMHIVERFRARGVPSEIVTASTKVNDRKEIIERLRRGQTRVVCNVGVFTEGFDLDVLGCVILARPTYSLTLHLQMIGRGMRPAPGKQNCIVIDHADNLRRHGFPQLPREWTLKAPDKSTLTKKAIDTRPPLAKKCSGCLALIPSGCTICPHCGTMILPETAPGRLVRLRNEPHLHRVR